jgi:hypothetical protein
MQQQCEAFSVLMNNWQGRNEQTDDMMMMGIQL